MRMAVAMLFMDGVVRAMYRLSAVVWAWGISRRPVEEMVKFETMAMCELLAK
jgi:hypothetical protein